MAYFDREQETLDRAGLESLQRRKLAALLEAILPANRFYQGKLGELARSAPLDELPFTTRAELQRDQAAVPPYGTNLSYPIEAYCRLHQTSGTAGEPLRLLDRAEDWAWWKRCWGMIFAAAGLGRHERICFPFSFGPFIGFWGAFDSAVALGHLSLPAGGMSTRARLAFLLENRATVICCTPTYALHMAEAAEREGFDIAGSQVRALIVAGEPGGSIPSVRRRIEAAWGARVFDHTGASEVGPHGMECAEAPGGVHILESEFIAEVIDPVTQRPVGEGQSGELVLTNLGRCGWPVIRYRTGDQVRLTRNRCACGRWFARMEGGILGRIDDMLIIRGNNVFPSAIEAILREHPDVVEFRMETRRPGAMTELRIDVEPRPDVWRRPAGDGGGPLGGLADALAEAIRDRLHFRPEVRLVEPESLPRFEMKARRLVKKADSQEGTTP